MSSESLVIYSMNKVGRLVPISNKMRIALKVAKCLAPLESVLILIAGGHLFLFEIADLRKLPRDLGI